MIETVQKVLLRDLATLAREVELYPDDAAPWQELPGLSNVGGTLVLHLAGNLQHFIGAVLGGSGYQRDRDAEFSRRGLSRAELLAEVQRAQAAVASTLPALAPERLGEDYPLPVQGVTVPVPVFLVHLCTHLAFHLGQLDAHRRVVTGQGGAGAQSMSALS